MRIKQLLSVISAIMIAAMVWSGCRKQAAKVLVNEEYYNDMLPPELNNFGSIDFYAANNPSDRIRLILKEPEKVNQEYRPLLLLGYEKRHFVSFSSPVASTLNKDCYSYIFDDSDSLISFSVVIANGVPQSLQFITGGNENEYIVSKYTTFEIFETEDDEYFYKVLNELESKSSRAKVVPEKIKGLIPKGYELCFCATGDLNLDKYDDAMIVLRNKDEYVWWILTGTSDNSLNINQVIGNALGSGYFGDKQDFDEPYFDVVIKKGHFTIEVAPAPGTNNREINTDHFKYSKVEDNWLLFRSDYIPNSSTYGNCCYNYHLTTHYVEKITFELFENE